MGNFGRARTLSRLALVVATLAPLEASAFAPPAGVLPMLCEAGLTSLGSDRPLDDTVAKEAWDHLTLGVPKEFARLKAENVALGESLRRSGPSLHAEAVARVRAKLHALGDPDVLRAFDSYAAAAERGRKELEDNLEIFANPEPHLTQGKLSDAERREFLKRAYAFLTKNGHGTPNMAHIADHLATQRDLAMQLREMGLDAAEVELAMMIHDLGKEYAHLPASYRTFVQSAFPDGKADFLAQQIFPHEFASMTVIERIGQEMGLPAEKTNRLKALIARHNAGYDPELPGSHFWNAGFAWPTFAKRLADRANGVPLAYPAVLSTDAGGHPTTVILTAIDRATSLTLSSQEKFAAALVGQKKWNNGALAEQIAGTAKNIGAEVENVLDKLRPAKSLANAQILELRAMVAKAFAPDTQRLVRLGEELPKMAKAEGAYADGATLVAGLPNDAVVYKTRTGRWHRVDADGKYYVANAAKDGWVETAGTPLGSDAPTRLFRNAIFLDYGYRPRSILDYAPPGSGPT